MRKRIQRVKVEQVKPKTNDISGKRLGKVRVFHDERRAFEVYSTK